MLIDRRTHCLRVTAGPQTISQLAEFFGFQQEIHSRQFGSAHGVEVTLRLYTLRSMDQQEGGYTTRRVDKVRLSESPAKIQFESAQKSRCCPA